MTDAELNELISEVEQDFEDLRKSEGSLSKASKEAKEEMKKDDLIPEEEQSEMAAPDMDQAAAPSEEAPAMDAPAADAPAAEEAAPEMEAAPSEEMPSEMPPEEQEMQGDEPNLEEIYGSMDEEELAEHYEAIKAAMASKWSSEPMADDAEMPAAEMGKAEEQAEAKEEKEESKEDDKDDAEDEEMKKYVSELETSVERLIKAQSSTLPSRKAVTEIVTKPGAEEVEELSADSFKRKH